MSGKPLPFLHRSKNNSRNSGETFRHRSPNRTSNSNSKPYHGNNDIKSPSISDSPYPRTQNVPKKTNQITIVIIKITLEHNHLTITEMEIIQDDHSQETTLEM